MLAGSVKYRPNAIVAGCRSLPQRLDKKAASRLIYERISRLVTLTLLVCKRDIRQPAMIICGEQDTAEIKLKLLSEMHRNGVGVGDIACG